MAGIKNTIYIKAEQNVEVSNKEVTLGDVVKMECVDKDLLAKLKVKKLLRIQNEGSHRLVVSILKIVEIIHEEFPNLEVQNMGVTDIIVTYEGEKNKHKTFEVIKVIMVVIVSFVGAAFAIMTFNNDSGTNTLFSQIYEMFMGKAKEGFSILELTYSIGLTVGILVFFNHFGKKRLTVDPTPIEIEMRLYEKDIQTTLIDDYSRKGKTLDVGKATSNGNYRS